MIMVRSLSNLRVSFLLRLHLNSKQFRQNSQQLFLKLDKLILKFIWKREEQKQQEDLPYP